MQSNRLRDIERTKSDGNRATKITYRAQKIALRNESPHLHRSRAIAVIRIEFRIDWCIMHAVTLVRRHRKNKKWRRQHRQNHLPGAQESPYGIESPHLRRSRNIAVIRIEFRIDWCIIQVQQRVRRHRKNKKWTHQHRHDNSPVHQKSS